MGQCCLQFVYGIVLGLCDDRGFDLVVVYLFGQDDEVYGVGYQQYE